MDAARHARRALGLLGDIPPGQQRDHVELNASVLLGAALEMLFSGSDEARAALERAVRLGAALDQSFYLTIAYPALIACLQALGDYAAARAVGAEALAYAAAYGVPGLDRVVRQFHAATLMWMGRVDAGAELLAPVLEDDEDLDDAVVGNAPLAAVSCGMWSLAGLVDWVQGRGGQAEAWLARAEAVGRRAEAPQALCLALSTQAIVRQLAGDVGGVHRLAEEALELALGIGNDWWFVWGQVLLGWSVAAGGNGAGGLALMREGLDHTGSVRQLRPYFLALLADREAAEGEIAGALHHLAEAAAVASATGETFFLPEVWRTEAQVRADAGAPADVVEAVLARARDLARSQQQWALAAR